MEPVFDEELFTTPRTDEELVERKAQEVVEWMKRDITVYSNFVHTFFHTFFHVGGWSGIGRRRVTDHVAAALDRDKGEYFGGCVRVKDEPSRTISIEYEIRNEIQKLLHVPILGGARDDAFWQEISMKLNWKPLVIIVDDLQYPMSMDEAGIPLIVNIPGHPGAVELVKIVYTRQPGSEAVPFKWRDFSRSFIDDFRELADEVALQMVLYEAHSAATAIKLDLPASQNSFLSRYEYMTSMSIRILAPTAASHKNIGNLKGEDVIQFLFCHRLLPMGDCPLALKLCMGYENIPLPYAEDSDENTCNTFALFSFLLIELKNRYLVQLQSFGNYSTTEPLEYMLASLTSSSSSSFSSSSAIMSRIRSDLVRHSKKLKQVDMGQWTQDLTRISFANNQIREILLPPSISGFLNLSTLLLHSNPTLREIPDDMFRFVPNLRVLDLSRCNIKTLPSSLSCLRKLRMLSLEQCKHLQTVEMTGLDKLEVLILRGCPLNELKKASWCHMRGLKLLWLQDGLTSLEELQLSLTSVKVFDQFHPLDLHPQRLAASSIQKCNIVISYPGEEEQMQRERTLDAHFYDWIGRLTSAAHPTFERVEYIYNRTLKIYGGEGLLSLYTITGMFHPHFLYLYNYQNAQAGIWPVDELQACYIECCNDIEYVFNSRTEGEMYEYLENLETLWISNLAKLRSVCNPWFVQGVSFGLLKSIYLGYCPNLLVLFPETISLPQLGVIEIRFCCRLEKLFALHTTGEIVLPKLERLRLFGLPKLTTICDDGHLPSLQMLEVRGCGNLRKVPVPSFNPRNSGHAAAAAATVLKVRGEEEWWKRVGGFSKDHIDFRVGFVSAAPKHIPSRWKRDRRPRNRR